MTVKNIIAALVVAVAVFATPISMNAQETKRILVDRSAEAVMEERKAVNDASIHDLKTHYADEGRAFDGNATAIGGGAIKAVVKKKAYQGISFGVALGGESFAGKISPLAGLTGRASFRKCYGSVEGYVTIGHPDELSDDQKKYPEFNGVGSVGIEVFHSKSLEHVFFIGAYGAFKAGKNSKYVDLGNGGYVWQKENAFNVGGGGSVSYIYSPKWSSVYHMVEFRAGANHKLHTEGNIEQTSFAFGGKKAYFQASLSYKLMFGLGKRTGYNASLKNKGYSESQIKSMVGLK